MADPFLDKLRVPFGDQKFRCVGKGCDAVWKKKSAYYKRVLKHAHDCHYLPSDLKRQVNDRLDQKSLGHELEAKQDAATGTDTKIDKSNVPENRKAGMELKRAAEDSGRVQLIKNMNHAVLKVICVCGLPPTIVDYPEWKDMLRVANPKYNPPSSKTFVDSLIPCEYAFVKRKQGKHLQECENLTISFDGGTTAGLQSIYTVHVITPDRRAFLVEGSEASRESHTAQHLFGVLDSVSEQA